MTNDEKKNCCTGSRCKCECPELLPEHNPGRIARWLDGKSFRFKEGKCPKCGEDQVSSFQINCGTCLRQAVVDEAYWSTL